MPRTDFSLGGIEGQGVFHLDHCGYSPVYNMVLPMGFWHTTDQLAQSVTLAFGSGGSIKVEVYASDTQYQWSMGAWSKVGPSKDVPGYPAALPSGPVPALVTVRAIWSKVTMPDLSSDESLEAHTYFDSLGLSNGTNIDEVDVAWSISTGALTLMESVQEATTDARFHATCVQQLRNVYGWAGTGIDVSADCGDSTGAQTVDYTESPYAPSWLLNLAYGCALEQDDDGSGAMPPVSVFRRVSDSQTITYSFGSRYPGLPSGSLTRATDVVYNFGASSISGDCAGTAWGAAGAYNRTVYREAETGCISTSISLSLVAFDQMESIDDLEANATHFVDQTLEWNATTGRWERSATFLAADTLGVPGTHSATWKPNSRYLDLQVPSSEDDTITVTLTDTTLQALGLPTADNTMTLHDRALDAIGIDTADWGDHDEHGGPYYGLLLIWVQSPLSVQWAQDDRGEAAPPSWWYDTVTTSPLTRQATIQAVASFGGGPSNPVRRDLAWHPTRRDENWFGEIDPGIAEADLWKHIGDWQRLSATKHLLAGTVIGGPHNMTSGNVTCGEEDPVDHTAYGIMPWSEDVTDWRLYRWVRFIITSDATDAWDLTVTVAYEWDDITDGYESATDDRRTSYQRLTHHGTAVYTVNVPGSAASANCDIDLIGANAPYLERVTSITLSGLPGGYDETVIEDVQLIAPTAGVWVESTDQRPVRYGGEVRYTCGSEPELLGTAKTPEEYGGWWAMGGHCVARGVRNPGRDVGIAPDWGMPFVIRRNTDCGALQDELMDFSAWHGQRVGDWGLEGLYGQLHNEITDAAMSDWVDGDDTPLGLATGAGWITHVPILLQFPVGSEDLLSAGRDQDGATDIPAIVRAGCLRPAQGMNWAHSGDGTAPVFGFKSILYGARLDVATSGTAPVGRAGSGLTYTLYEHPSTGSDRLVTTAATDADSRLRFSRGVNEFRHVEYGADAMSDPDWLNRYDYLSDVLAPGEVVGDLDFGQHHYQVIPTLGVVVVLPDGALARVSLTRPIGDGCVILAYQESGTLEVWARRSPDHGEHWMPDEYLADGVLPSATRRADGTAAVAYVFEGAAYVTIWNGTAWGGPQLILADADVVDHEADRFSSAHYVVAQDWTTGDLTCHVTWERGGAWTSIEVGAIAADADADTVPSIKQAADGSLRVAYIAGGSVVTKHSNDEGVTWV